jgi:thymidylate synthase (FAD)
MRVIEQSWAWVQRPELPLQIIEQAGRTCYKSEDAITADSAKKFVGMILNLGHESVIEHVAASIRFVTNRGVTHELVRHRLCAFSQESTRFVCYDGTMEFIKPVWWEDWTPEMKRYWTESLEKAEESYRNLRKSGAPAEQAREVLPNSLKTEIVVTANMREWRHILKTRCEKAAHPQIRQLMLSCRTGFQSEFPVLFDDL